MGEEGSRKKLWNHTSPSKNTLCTWNCERREGWVVGLSDSFSTTDGTFVYIWTRWIREVRHLHIQLNFVSCFCWMVKIFSYKCIIWEKFRWNHAHFHFVLSVLCWRFGDKWVGLCDDVGVRKELTEVFFLQKWKNPENCLKSQWLFAFYWFRISSLSRYRQFYDNNYHFMKVRCF